MFYTMNVSATPFDSDASGDSLRPIIRYKPGNPGKAEMINARWGSNPRFTDGVEFRFVRSEGKTFPAHRCLVPASEFQMTVGEKRFRVKLDDGNFFYLAGVWEPAMGEWPLAFRIITVAANPEVSRYQDRHGAVILRRQVKDWLDGQVPEMDILVTPPAHTFDVEEISSGRRKPVQQSLAI
ncbi:SOS response-associated peptidase family protein [Novosphingobium aquimarinum]|jgi:putative SOS response-associated peptidase YedK|uniref:SOS response-associated peptidase family protein n=1 Tax=Novosphingobium aquimarinum TaxID=2682494 RepID=UPI001E574248|nr:SOS response-associated peptidase family protein [Novosphingobium aquimarinum]|tara:strand:- start:148 stop:690 length:543 start_codon:yes stop_codon:yes gene_type:complete